MTLLDTVDETVIGTGLRLLWVELTSTCNLSCVHCYADSGPEVRDENPLTTTEYIAVLDAAVSNGCATVQFIGGEPTLYRDLPVLLKHARTCGFADIEVFTNATHISTALLECVKSNNVRLATSFYSDEPAIHDAITTCRGSHARTVDTIQRILAAGVALRVAVIVMETNAHRVSQTKAFLAWIHRLGSGPEWVVTPKCPVVVEE